MDNEYFASINEVSKRLSVPAHTLRYWEKQFPVAIKPTTGAGGRRYYRTETVDRLIVIKDLLYTHGMTIAGVKKLLRDGTFPDSAAALSLESSSAGPVSHPNAPSPAVAETVDLAIGLLEQAKKILE